MITTNRIVRRKRRVSSNIFGTQERPRLSLFRSNKYIYAQAIDDKAKQTLAAISTLGMRKIAKKKQGNKSEEAKQAGLELAKLLIAKKIQEGVLDRGAFTYNGRVKAFAEGLREGGLRI